MGSLKKSVTMQVMTAFSIAVVGLLVYSWSLAANLQALLANPNIAQEVQSFNWLVFVPVLAVFISVVWLLSLSSSIDYTFKEARKVVNGIANSDFSEKTVIKYKDAAGQLLFSLVNLQYSLQSKLSDDGAQAVDSSHVALVKALEVCDTSVMLADQDNNITYLNQSVKDMLSAAEKDIQSELPSFQVSHLMGTNMDSFHKNPNHQRNMVRNLSEVYKTEISVGELTFSLIATPIFDDSGERLGTVVEWKDRTAELKRQEKEQQEAANNARIRSALDVCQANVMMADENLNIIYVNESGQEMIKNAESDLRKDLPNFNASQLLGTCVDDFHKNPAHQRSLIANLRAPYITNIKAGGRTFNLVATPVFNESGKNIGTVVEWNDRTEALKVEEEAQKVNADNARIRSALDVCQANVMMADENFNIVYMNNCIQDMLKSAESDIRKELPNFDTSNLMGTCVDSFHKNPSHQRSMLDRLQGNYQANIEIGGRTFNLVATPVKDNQNERIGTVVEWVDRTEALKLEQEQKRVADDNARIKQALDGASANVMVADKEMNIVYMNKAVLSMMQTAESDIRKDIPSFNSSALVGSNADIFHKNPVHQRNMVAALSDTLQSEIIVGGRTFKLVANPIHNQDNERIGAIVEWTDRTAEVNVEREIDQLVEAAGSGDLSRRIEIQNKEGFFLKLGTGLNELIAIVDEVVTDTAKMLDGLAHGDLTERIEKDYQGAFGKLKRDANATSEKLTEIMGQIIESAQAVSTGAEEIAQGNADLSQRTEEQASSLEETASSMEEMTSAVKQSGDNASHANDLASNAREKAQEGGAVVNDAVSAMEEINMASKKIADIIGVIDEIAFQTNLLALNAAVEAARAGEQGRGFAVVAGEVRNLAQRSAGAAKEIKDLIRDSVEKVDTGTEMVNRSGETLQEIVEAVTNVNTIIAEISATAQEQASGIDQVNKAVAQMDEMTQQNAALVEEASAAGEAMAEQSRAMLGLMSFFSTAGNSVGSGGSLESYNSSAALHDSEPKTQYVNAHPSNKNNIKPVSPTPNSSHNAEWDEF